MNKRARQQVRAAAGKLGAPEVEREAAKAGKRARPGLQAPDVVMDLAGGGSPVDAPVFFFQYGRPGGARRILRLGREVLVFDRGEGPHQQTRAIFGKARREFDGSFIGTYRGFTSQKDAAGIETFIDLHGSDSRDLFAASHR